MKIETFNRDRIRKERIYERLCNKNWFLDMLEKTGWVYDSESELHFIRDMREETIYIRDDLAKFLK